MQESQRISNITAGEDPGGGLRGLQTHYENLKMQEKQYKCLIS